MNKEKLPDFGIIKSKIQFNGFWDWLVTYNDVHTLWQAQPTYIIVQILILIGGLLTLYHAFKYGGRFVYLWLGIIFHGLLIESVSYSIPEIDNFWHSQTSIILLGRRLPLHIIFVYAVFIYIAAVVVDKLRLPLWSEPFAVGLMIILIDYPYDLMSVKFVHWTWHDTDPNIYDRHYHVPWNSFYFHAAFGGAFIFWFHFTRRFLTRSKDKWTPEPLLKELFCTLLAPTLAIPTGVLLFIPNYHVLHDLYNLHAEVTFFLLFAIYVILTLSGLMSLKTIPQHLRNVTDFFLLAYLAVYYLIFFGMAVIGDPTSEISIGLHEPIGPCEEKVAIKTAFGQILYKRKYLCVTDNDESYLGWSCLPTGKPPERKIGEYYTICGTPFENRLEYIILMLIITIVAAGVFLNIFYRTTLQKKVFKKKN